MNIAEQVCATRYDGLEGIRRIEIASWPGKVEVAYHDSSQFPGLVMMAPLRSVMEYWNIQEYKRGTLLVAPHLMGGDELIHSSEQPNSPMVLYFPLTVRRMQVVNLNDL